MSAVHLRFLEGLEELLTWSLRTRRRREWLWCRLQWPVVGSSEAAMAVRGGCSRSEIESVYIRFIFDKCLPSERRNYQLPMLHLVPQSPRRTVYGYVVVRYKQHPMDLFYRLRLCHW
jgi:hypothetical protein